MITDDTLMDGTAIFERRAHAALVGAKDVGTGALQLPAWAQVADMDVWLVSAVAAAIVVGLFVTLTQQRLSLPVREQAEAPAVSPSSRPASQVPQVPRVPAVPALGAEPEAPLPAARQPAAQRSRPDTTRTRAPRAVPALPPDEARPAPRVTEGADDRRFLLEEDLCGRDPTCGL